MSIRPIDMQVVIPRSTDVGRSQQHMENQTSLQQQQFAEQMQKVSAERQSQVENATKSEGGKIKRENASKEKQGKSQHNSQMKPSDSDDSDTTTKTDAETDIQIDPVRGHIIDIKT